MIKKTVSPRLLEAFNEVLRAHLKPKQRCCCSFCQFKACLDTSAGLYDFADESIDSFTIFYEWAIIVFANVYLKQTDTIYISHITLEYGSTNKLRIISSFRVNDQIVRQIDYEVSAAGFDESVKENRFFKLIKRRNTLFAASIMDIGQLLDTLRLPIKNRLKMAKSYLDEFAAYEHRIGPLKACLVDGLVGVRCSYSDEFLRSPAPSLLTLQRRIL